MNRRSIEILEELSIPSRSRRRLKEVLKDPEAEKDKDWKRMVVRFRRLEVLEKRVAELEAKASK